MRPWIVPTALALAVAVPAFAQGPGSRVSRLFGGKPGAPAQGSLGTPKPTTSTPVAPPPNAAAATPAKPGNLDPKVLKSGAEVPAPISLDQVGPAQIALPTEPIEPYLLTADAGPFMVLAHTFRGPDASRYALALALELRGEYQLPAFIFLQKTQPMHSNIRNVPPTAPPYVRQPEVALPERVRLYDEAAVLVGNCKSLDESEALQHKVKKLHPRCIDGLPSIMPWRKGQGLSRAMRTTNPLIPAQVLYPRKADPLITQMNAGPFSLFNCPGRFTLQVAEFTGRSTLDANDARFKGERMLRASPLATAADDAQQLAESLAKVDDIKRTGYQPYVYHDRHASKVTIGSFESPEDPKAVALRKKLSEIAVNLNQKKVTDVLLVPAPVLMDLQTLPPH